MSKGLKQFLTIIITFFATLVLAYFAAYGYVCWFDYGSDVLWGNEIFLGDGTYSVMNTLSDSDIAAADSILSEAGIPYRLGERDAIVLVRGIDEEKAIHALVDSGYDFECQVNDYILRLKPL